MEILLFKKCKSEPCETIKCEEFFLYRNEGEDFKIHYTVFGDEEPENYILNPDDDVYMIDII